MVLKMKCCELGVSPSILFEPTSLSRNSPPHSHFTSKARILIGWIPLTNIPRVYKIHQPQNQSKNRLWNWLFKPCPTQLGQIDHRKPARPAIFISTPTLTLSLSSPHHPPPPSPQTKLFITVLNLYKYL